MTRCPCAIDLHARYTIGEVRDCIDCGQLWKAVPAEGIACSWVRVERKAGEVVNLDQRRKGGR